MATNFNTATTRIWNIPEGEVAKVTATGMTNPDYARLDFVQNTVGYTSTIDLGIPCNTNYTYIMQFRITTTPTADTPLFGSTSGNNAMYFFYRKNLNKYAVQANTAQNGYSNNNLNAFVQDQTETVTISKTGAFFTNIKGGTSWGFTLNDYTSSNFRVYFSGNSGINVYSIEIRDQYGATLSYCIPSRRNEDGQCGLYDTVRQQFFIPSANPDKVTGGTPLPSNILWSRVPTSQMSQYTYLESNGNPYCQVSDINLTSTTAIEIKGQWNSNSGTGGWRKMFGNSDLQMFGLSVGGHLCWRLNSQNYPTSTSVLGDTTPFITQFIPNDGIYFNGTKYQDLNNITFNPTTQSPFYIFDYDPNSTGSMLRANFRTYYIKMWDTANPNVLTHYLIPVQWRSTQQTGLYDLFGGGFYDNVNASVTTAFTTGQEL